LAVKPAVELKNENIFRRSHLHQSGNDTSGKEGDLIRAEKHERV
jgi:hypothetical protein